ncbi:hypothetical protein [Flectobacillus sp. BAB-3569]|uniref:hypothetical protein n=1 Tax=Flectobacillus sp. BAB-3569 TaxID=1509483 RepID=UPI000BA36AC3|nr:hypothetical protein [Flectobacillus sp. BAB-3569]PAC27777.1 hypothetical protein BWI92_21430 [Flectobacillus sp. BAB-3569]
MKNYHNSLAPILLVCAVASLFFLFLFDCCSGKVYQEKCQIVYADYRPAWNEIVTSTDKKGNVSHSLKRHAAKYYLGIETIGGYRAKVDVDAFTYAEFQKKEAAVYRCRIGKWSKIHYFENVE